MESDLRLLEEGADQAFDAGRFEQAEALFLRARAATANDTPAVKWGLTFKAARCRHLTVGPDAALEFLNHEGIGDPRSLQGAFGAGLERQLVDCCSLLAELSMSVGQFVGAIDFIETAYDTLKSDSFLHDGDLAAVATNLLLLRARADFERGEFEDASLALDEIDPRAVDPAALLDLRARIATVRGEYDVALAHRESILERDKTGGVEDALLARYNLAALLLTLGQIAEVQRHVEEAASIARDAKLAEWRERLAMLSSACDARLRAAAAQSASHSAIEVLGGTRVMRDSTGEMGRITVDDESRGDWYADRVERDELRVAACLSAGDLSSAIALLNGMLQRYESTDSALISARCQLLVAAVAFETGDVETAEAVLDAHLPILDEAGWLPFLHRARYLRARCYASRGDVRGHRESLRGAAAVTGQMSARLEGATRRIFLLDRSVEEEERLVAEARFIAERLDADAQNDAAWLSPDTAQLVREFALLVDANRRPIVPTGSVDDEQLGGAIDDVPSGEAALLFAVLPDAVFVTVACGEGVWATSIPIARTELRLLVDAQLQQVQHSEVTTFEPARGEPDDTARAVVARRKAQSHGATENVATDPLAGGLRLATTLARLPSSIQSLRIVPDDALRLVPWAALRIDGAFLVERFEIAIGHTAAPISLNAHVALRDSLAIVAGCSRGTASFPPLPGVLGELQRVADTLVDLGVRVGAIYEPEAGDARAELVRFLPRAQLLHVASHGVFKPEHPGSSGLVFTTRDGALDILTLHELVTLDLRPVEHVVLSTCWGADSYSGQGRVVVSLPEILWRRGVEFVLASLFPVYDAVAPEFFARYYTELREHPPARALRIAQLFCLHGRVPNAAAPRYWCAFQLYC